MSRHRSRLTTLDGQVLTVDCSPDESVVAAAERAGVHLPAQCRGGSCGACHATASGEYKLGSCSSTVLPQAEADTGGVLLCQTFAMGPLEIALPYDSGRIVHGSIAERRATITDLHTVAVDTVRLLLQLEPDADGGVGLMFEPGQFIEISPPGSAQRRAYSLANTSNWDGVAELFIRLRPGGLISEYLRAATVGDQLTVRGPQGGFGLRETGLRPRWFVAGGTGLAPMLSMLRQMAEFAEPHPTSLVFGVNTAAEIFATGAVAELAATLPGFTSQVRVMRPEPGCDAGAGTPVDALAELLAELVSGDGQTPDIYVCGPPVMVEATKSAAVAAGLSHDRVVAENFAPPAG